MSHKTKDFFYFRKQIVVTEWYCGKEGMEIHYDFNGKEMSLMAPVQQSCNLLDYTGAIKGYEFENDTHWVKVEIELQGANPKVVCIEWEQFILSYEFSQCDAIFCAAWHELEKNLHKTTGGPTT